MANESTATTVSSAEKIEKASLFRSEEMILAQMVIPVEIAHPTVAELGELGAVEFRDLNPDLNAFQRSFVLELRRLDDLDRRLRYLWAQVARLKLPIRQAPRGPSLRARSRQEMEQLETNLLRLEDRMRQMHQSGKDLQRRFAEMKELSCVLRETKQFFVEAHAREEVGTVVPSNGERSTDGLGSNLPLVPPSDIESAKNTDAKGNTDLSAAVAHGNLGFVTGVISRQKIATFERILWRAFRGNLFMNSVEIQEKIRDPVTDKDIQKNVFIIFAHGREILSKTKRLSQSLGATLYPISENAARRVDDEGDVNTRLMDMEDILRGTREAQRTELNAVAEEIDTWNVIIQKEKAIYHTMNMFNARSNRKTLVAEAWVPKPALPSVRETLKAAAKAASEQSGSSVGTVLQVVKTNQPPPTYHRTNKFSASFQGIIDAYGAARYQEVNPGLFTVITFPFLFAVMFGDFGHGIMLTLVGLALVGFEKRLSTFKGGEIFEMLYGGRHIILLMGAFSIYTGAVYNDMFSRFMSWFSTGWNFVRAKDGSSSSGTLYIGEQIGVYPFGIDWAWQDAENKLLFLNSLKMKMSVVLGVSHMLFGIVLNIFNHVHFGQKVRVVAETLPQFVFMVSIFGYLVSMIFFKWATDWSARRQTPPALLNMLIFMVLKPGNVLKEDRLYEGQEIVQLVLLIVAGVCVPWILFAWPLALRVRMRNDKEKPDEYLPVNGETLLDNGEGSSSSAVVGGDHAESDEETFGDIMMHQVIHTIEFVLGTISNTASYLRLWALSLAHAQLSEVLWDMVLALSFPLQPLALRAVALVGLWGAWFVLTILVLLIMEGLSAFLHALRLHWVEFNGKFYNGDGYLYSPFAFKRVLKEMESEQQAALGAALADLSSDQTNPSAGAFPPHGNGSGKGKA